MAVTKKNSYKPLCSCRPQLIEKIVESVPLLMILLSSFSMYFNSEATREFRQIQEETLCDPIRHPRLREEFFSVSIFTNLCIDEGYAKKLFNDHGAGENLDDCKLKAAIGLESHIKLFYFYKFGYYLTLNLTTIAFVIFNIRLINRILKLETPWAYIPIIFGLIGVVYYGYITIDDYEDTVTTPLAFLEGNMQNFLLFRLIS